MIVGLTGPNASGKGEAAGYLRSKGFEYHSLSDVLREEARKRGMEASRENLIRLGNEMRREKGLSYLASMVKEALIDSRDHVVDSIRNPAEVGELRKKKGFILIGVDAPLDVRFERSIRRKRPGDAGTLEEFIEKEKKENIANPENQQLKKCMEMADKIVTNKSSIEDFHREIDEAIAEKT